MAGSVLTITARDRAVLAEVQRHGVLTRDQLTRLGLFRSKTRANERLKKLTAAGYLDARRQGNEQGGPRFVYLPGRSLWPGQPNRRLHQTSALFLAHQLGLVDIHIAFARTTAVSRWISDRESVAFKLQVVPDAYVEYVVSGLTYCAFVEYDRGTESLTRIEKKVRAYVELAHSGQFERSFGRRFFRVLAIADTPGRLQTLSDATARVTHEIVRLTTRATLIEQGPLAPIWRRPADRTLESLTSS
jgi:hypothetical protein